MRVSDPNMEQGKPNDAGWFVAVVRVNCEKRIADAIHSDLARKNIWFDYWVPMVKEHYVDKRSGKRRVRQRVFLSTFIFCHIGKSSIDEVRFRLDVYKMLSMPGSREIYRIPDGELEAYRHLVENSELPVTAHSGPLRKGQKVRITEGCMAGIEAYVQRLSATKAVIGNEIRYISGATIEIDRKFLEVVGDGQGVAS